MYLVKFGKQAEEDKKLLKGASLEQKAKELLNILVVDPFQNPPPYEVLVGNLSGFYSRRINLQLRLVYEVHHEPSVENGVEYEGTVRITRMWTHYEGMRSGGH